MKTHRFRSKFDIRFHFRALTFIETNRNTDYELFGHVRVGTIIYRPYYNLKICIYEYLLCCMNMYI